METLLQYARTIVAEAGNALKSGEVFAKVLRPNDDSGRHGVLIPTDAYSFFPPLDIPDATKNETIEFSVFDAISKHWKDMAFKYYERYPERRITRLNPVINDHIKTPRLLVFLRVTHLDGTSGYYADAAVSGEGGRFNNLFRTIFGKEVTTVPENFIVRPVDSAPFSVDVNLAELLGRFDEVKTRGWIDTMRRGPTGIGYTFETLLGIKENNDQIADFKGIEIKCKGVKEGSGGNSGKINLFQSGPIWLAKLSAKERVKVIGRPGSDGLFSCHSQVTTTANNLGLLLQIISDQNKIDLRKEADALGYWPFAKLEKRLTEKHSRAVFVKANIRRGNGKTQYRYDELVYCEKPNIDRFVDLVSQRHIVFEFIYSSRPNGVPKNHGYPWRLSRAEFLDQLFAFQIKLRSASGACL